MSAKHREKIIFIPTTIAEPKCINYRGDLR